MKSITVTEFKKMMDEKADFQFIDVRESYEIEVSEIGGEHIPMGEVMVNIDKIKKDIPVIVHCRSGGRSAAVIQALSNQGYDNLINLTGGIAAWKAEIDPTIEIA